MELRDHRAASVESMRDGLEEGVQERAGAFHEHLTTLSYQDNSAAPVREKNPFILKRITQRHKDMAVLSLQGLSRGKVAEFCGCTPEYITMINKQPLIRAYIADLEAHADLRLRGLYEKSISAIDAGLTSPKISDKLAAAQLQLSTIGKLKPPEDIGKETAEDVVSAMLIQGSNVQINVRK